MVGANILALKPHQFFRLMRYKLIKKMFYVQSIFLKGGVCSLFFDHSRNIIIKKLIRVARAAKACTRDFKIFGRRVKAN